jgi:outer membrane lipoprotein LolB
MLLPSRILFALLIGYLSACSSTSRQPQTEAVNLIDDHWHINGKLALKSAHGGHNLGLQWRQQGNNYTITLRGPLGLGQADIQGDEQGILSVTHAGTRMDREQALLWQLQHFGWELPIQHMKHWILGNPNPILAVESSSHSESNLTSVQQGEWHVSLSDYRQTDKDGSQYTLPYQLDISRDDYHAKLRIRDRQAKRPRDNE